MAFKKVSRKEVQAQLDAVQAMVVRANVLKTVTGGIPTSIINAIDNALKLIVPMVSFMGDFELSALLSSLNVWLQKKKTENLQEQQNLTNMQSMGYDDYWSTPF